MTFAAVLLVHALVLAAIWLSREGVVVVETAAVTASIITAIPKPVSEPPPRLAVRLVAPAVIVPLPDIPDIAISPVSAEVAAAPASESISVAQSVPAAGPETLSGGLELQCPERHPPRYPAMARREHEQGEVRMRVEIDESGRIKSVSIVGSSGSPRLDEAAREAIQSWRCRPAEINGKPVPAVALQTMAFKLERR